MRKYSLTAALSVGLFAALSAQATYTVYDNFDGSGGFIAPHLWRGHEVSGGVREALRLLIGDPLVPGNRRLLLFNVAYGGVESNAGTESGILASNFTNPGAVGGIRATVEAANVWAGACAANPAGVTTAMAAIGGAFFNPNPTTLSAAGDVWATVGVERKSNATTPLDTLAVVARLTQCMDGKCEQRALLGEQTLGSATKTERLSLGLEWDRTNKRFVFQRGAASAAIAYSIEDGMAPGIQTKGAFTINEVANCEGGPRAAALMEAYFDNVSTAPTPSLPVVFPPDQYEPNEAPNAAVFLGNVSDGAFQTWNQATIHSLNDRDWFRVRAVETTNQTCWPGDDQWYRTTFQLTDIPAGSNYDLRVRFGSITGTEFASTASGNSAETIQIRWAGTCGSADAADFYIEVRYASGLASDAKYRLTVTHARD